MQLPVTSCQLPVNSRLKTQNSKLYFFLVLSSWLLAYSPCFAQQPSDAKVMKGLETLKLRIQRFYHDFSGETLPYCLNQKASSVPFIKLRDDFTKDVEELEKEMEVLILKAENQKELVFSLRQHKQETSGALSIPLPQKGFCRQLLSSIFIKKMTAQRHEELHDGNVSPSGNYRFYRVHKETQCAHFPFYKPLAKKEGNPFKRLSISFAVLNLLDLHSTYLVLQQGGEEKNPLVRSTVRNKPLAVSAKIVSTTAILVYVRKLKKKNSKKALRSLSLANVLLGIVVLNNYLNIE